MLRVCHVASNASRKSRIFASRLHGLLGSVQQYCNIVDTCVGPNQIASLVWGSIKLVILTSSNFVEYFDKLSERVARLSNYCPRFSEYGKLFSTSTRLQQALSDFHAVVVSFCSKALHVIQERGVKRFSKSVWKSFKVEFKEVEERISEAKNEVAEELALASEQEAHKFRSYLTVEVEKNNSFRVEQRAEIEASRDFRSHQRHALQQVEARQIQKILREQDHLKRSFAAHSSTIVIYYFFDSSEKKSLQASAFLRCILHQAITVDNLLPDSQRRLESLFEDQMGESEPATDDLGQLFCHFLRKFKCAFLLIDGLDEVSKTEQRNVKALLTTIRTIDSARIFAMTHADMDMTKVLTCCLRLQIKADDLEHDIAAFIQSQIDMYSQNGLLGCSSSALDLIKQKLVSDAEGMFLWADLQFKAILDAPRSE
ncbi:hypothetical protein E8E12_000178 [Didymella heteroderae]|uniref:NACHT domain-containing protein n=1 Tax=Didymella heteroderae TaxID=1769908 RepID=A0A9P4WFB5_9PLEO|nr:hypothetical protein E8E12_000178 [Didymella heteroderae]